ncbi:hypothetical protein AALA48_05630, partial [Bifidobacterium pseudolongum]
ERLYDCRRALLKTASLRTPRQRERVETLLADPVNDALRLAHGAYQRIIACYRHKDPRRCRRMMGALIDALAEPAATRLYFVKLAFWFLSLAFFGFVHGACRRVVICC